MRKNELFEGCGNSLFNKKKLGIKRKSNIRNF